MKAIAYFEGTTERVPNPEKVIHQAQSGRPMVWRETDRWGNGKWAFIEWASADPLKGKKRRAS